MVVLLEQGRPAAIDTGVCMTQTTRRAVNVAAARTAIGTARKGLWPI
jgi:hypothetical protein